MSDSSKKIPLQERVSLTYGGVSSVSTHTEQEGQSILLTTPSEHSSAKANVRLKDTILFREALIAFYKTIHRSYHYRPSSPDTNVRYNEWRPSLKEASAGDARRLFYSFLEKEDPEAHSILDPIISIQPDGINFEAFSDDSRMYAVLSLSRDSYEIDDEHCGTTYFDMGTDLYQGAQLLRKMKGETRLVVGAPTEKLSESCQARIEKNLNVSDEWLRSVLQLQATLTLPVRKFSLSRMDLYSMLRQLRLNKTKRADEKSMRFTLVPGMFPEISLEPWEWQHISSCEPYKGSRSEIIRIWDRKDLLVLDRLLPYIERVDVHTCGEALPSFWVVRCPGVTLTLGSSGFRQKNWPRGILMDIDLPRKSEWPDGAAKVLKALPDTGESCSAEMISAETGLDSAEVRSIMRSLSQDGEIIFDVTKTEYRRRPIEVVKSRLDKLLYRNLQEKRAYELVNAGVVKMSSKWLQSGDVEVRADISDDAYHNAIYEPFFVIKAEGQLRRQRCTCSFSLNPNNKGLPCEHIKALWIQYQITQKNQSADQLEVDNSTLIKRRKQGDEIHEISLGHRRLEETWEVKGKGDQRRSILIFPSVEAAREAYLKRVKHLKIYGYLDASGS